MGVTYKNPKAKVEKEKSILIYADFGCTTGFANVIKELIDVWSKKASKKTTFYIFALNCFAEKEYNYLPNVVVIPAYLLPLAIENDFFQKAALLDIIHKCDFDVIYMLNDIEVIGDISGDLSLMNEDRKKGKRKQFKTIFYFPIDSLPRIENLSFLQKFNEIVTFTDYAKGVIDTHAPKIVSDKIQVLHHGVNTNDFYKLPQEEIEKAKIKMFVANKIFFGTVNRNSARKDLATIVLAFHSFLNAIRSVSSPDSKQYCLYMHCNPLDASGVNLKFLALSLGLVENKDIFFPQDFSENQGVDVKELNVIYNTFDCFVTSTTAEGWGLTVTEAMATETPIIAPCHTSLQEITNFGKYAFVHSDFDTVVFVNDGTKVRYKTKVASLIRQLHLFHSSSVMSDTNLIKMTSGGLEHVKNYKWSETANRFWELMEKYLK